MEAVSQPLRLTGKKICLLVHDMWSESEGITAVQADVCNLARLSPLTLLHCWADQYRRAVDCVLTPAAHQGRSLSAVCAEKVAKKLSPAAVDAVVSTVSSPSGSSPLTEWGQEKPGHGLPVLAAVPVPAKAARGSSVKFFWFVCFYFSGFELPVSCLIFDKSILTDS